MLSQGQIVFAAVFVCVFAIAAVLMYRKDARLHRTFYKGSHWVLIGFLIFLGLLFVIKTFLKR